MDEISALKLVPKQLYTTTVDAEISLQAKHLDFVPVIRRFRRYATGAFGQLERRVEPASSERTAEHPEIIIIAAFMKNMTGLTMVHTHLPSV